MRGGGTRAAELIAAGVPVTVFPVASLKTGLIPQMLAFRRFLKQHRFDVVHSFDVPSAYFSLALARMAGVPVVLSSQRGHRELLTPWRVKAMRLCDRLVHGVVVNCLYLAAHLEQDEGVPARKIHLCYNGLDTTRFHPAGERAELPFPPGSVVIGTICALRPEKNLPLLVEAFAAIAAGQPRARLVIVGGGPERQALEELVRRRGLESKVHFQPSVGDTAPWFRSLDIFVLPSRSEAFSNSIMEAMGCGVPPVVSATGGNTELVGEGRGLLFEPGNAAELISRLEKLQDGALRAQIGQAAARWVAENLPVEKMARTMGGIYSRLLEALKAN